MVFVRLVGGRLNAIAGHFGREKTSDAPNSNAPECVAPSTTTKPNIPPKSAVTARDEQSRVSAHRTILSGAKSMNKKAQEIQNILVAINGLLNWGFISEETRIQLEMFKADLENELRFVLDQQAAAQAVS
jgi:hypothetical protein